MKATRYGQPLLSAQSTASNFMTKAYNVLDIDCESIQIDYTGSPSGTFKVQVSNNYQEDNLGNVLNAGTWTALYFNVNGSSTPTSTIAVPSSPSPIFIDIFGTGAAYLRVAYTGSGTGTATIVLAGKRLGD